MMKPTIIYTHPWEGSYNFAILASITSEYTARNIDYQLIDLYRDKFDASLYRDDLALYQKGLSTDPLVEKYQQYLSQTSELIIIGPIWWYELPAIFKGFLDKVLLINFAFVDGDNGIIGKLSHIEKTTIITTSGSTKQVIGNYVEEILVNRTLSVIGLKNIHCLHLGEIDKISQTQRKEFITQIRQQL